MKAIVNTGVGKVEWKELAKPEPGHNQVRIKTAFCGICATDLEMIRGWKRTGYPAIPGHEWSGVVDATGDGVEKGLRGSSCVADNILSDGGEVGFEYPGGYSEYFLTEADNIRTLPANFPLREAALIEPLAVCIRGMKRLRLLEGGPVLVIGDGPIGLLFVAVLKAGYSMEIVCAGGRGKRLEMAHSLGAVRILNYHEISGNIKELLGERSFTAVIETSGSVSGMDTALSCAAKGGKILAIGDYGGHRADFIWNTLLHNELELIGSNTGADAWDEAVTLAASGRVPVGRLISGCFPATEFESALRTAQDSRDAVKIVIEWET